MQADVEGGRHQGAAAAQAGPRGDQGDPGRERDHDRLVDERELRHAEVELELERREPDQEAAGDRCAAQLHEDHVKAARLGVALRAGAHALAEQDPDRERRERRAGDHQDVGRAPQRHVLAEEAVPEVVEREPGDRERAADEQEHAAERGMPALADLDRRRGLAAGAQQHGDEAGEDDPRQAGEDEVVGRVGERAGVATVVDVRGDVPVEAEHGDQQGTARDRAGQRDPARQAGHASGEAREAVERRDAALTVGPREHQPARREHHRDDRRDDELAGGGAAGGLGPTPLLCARERREHRARREREAGQPERRAQAACSGRGTGGWHGGSLRTPHRHFKACTTRCYLNRCRMKHRTIDRG